MGLDELNSKYDDILVMVHLSSEVDFKTSFTTKKPTIVTWDAYKMYDSEKLRKSKYNQKYFNYK